MHTQQASQEIGKDLGICWYAAIIWIAGITVRSHKTNSCEEHSKTESAGLTGMMDEEQMMLCIISVPNTRLLASFPGIFCH